MQGSVHKKKAEVDLWEIVTTERKTMPKSGAKRQEGARAASARSTKSLQIIGQDEMMRPAGQGRYAQPGRTAQSVRESRPEQPIRQGRTAQSSGRSRTAQQTRQSRAAQSIRVSRPEQPVRQGRTAQSSGRSRTAQQVRQSRAAQSVRVSRPEQPVRQGRTAQSSGRSRTAQQVRQSRAAQSVRVSRPPQMIRQERSAQAFRQERSPQAIQRRKARKRRALLYRGMAFCMVMLCIIAAFMLVGLAYRSVQEWKQREVVPVAKIPVVEETEPTGITAPDIMVSYLDINDYSRPGTKLDKINNIFVHYTANPGTSAENNRSYFSNLAQTKERSASAHYIIGYEGEIIQCIPVEEQAYAVISRNEDSISIECCYLEKDGEFTQATYDSLIHLLAWLTQEYDLETGDILRHYDCGGKLCPLYYVENEDAWDQLLADVEAYRIENGVE